MNCQLCKNESEAYLLGKLPEGTKAQVENHLKECEACNHYFTAMLLSEKVMDEEKMLKPNPYLSTRVLASIDALEKETANAHKNVLKPALIGFSVAAAIFLGVLFGNIYQPVHSSQHVPVEMAYMNDAALESVYLISNE